MWKKATKWKDFTWQICGIYPFCSMLQTSQDVRCLLFVTKLPLHYMGHCWSVHLMLQNNSAQFCFPKELFGMNESPYPAQGSDLQIHSLREQITSWEVSFGWLHSLSQLIHLKMRKKAEVHSMKPPKQWRDPTSPTPQANKPATRIFFPSDINTGAFLYRVPPFLFHCHN